MYGKGLQRAEIAEAGHIPTSMMIKTLELLTTGMPCMLWSSRGGVSHTQLEQTGLQLNLEQSDHKLIYKLNDLRYGSLQKYSLYMSIGVLVILEGKNVPSQ